MYIEQTAVYNSAFLPFRPSVLGLFANNDAGHPSNQRVCQRLCVCRPFDDASRRRRPASRSRRPMTQSGSRSDGLSWTTGRFR